MKKFFLIFIFLFFLVNTYCVLANSSPVNYSEDDILKPVPYEKKSSELKNIANNETTYSNEKQINALRENKKIELLESDEKKANLINVEPKDKILQESSRYINAIYPLDVIQPTNTYPGYRGPNQLVVYTRDYGRTTGTNEFGKEAVIINGMVASLTGANSNIPYNGFVVSGHGNAKKWINENLKIGTKVEITDRTIKAYTTVDSYRYHAKIKIKEVEDVLVSSDNGDEKFVYYYLKKAKQQYKKSLRANSDTALEYAKESIKNSSVAYRYTLPYIKDELKGTWIRPTQKSLSEVQNILNLMKQTGINNVFLETYYHGRTIFPSKTMEKYGFEEQNPEFKNFDVLSAWVSEAHKRNINVHAWFESFYVGNKSPEINAKSILAVRPTWMNRPKQKADYQGYVSHSQEHNGYFLDPANPEVTEFLYTLIKEIVNNYDVDGVNIDYVRYPNISKENLNNQWGYTPYAREEFKQLYNIDPVDIQPKGDKWDEWCDYRKDKVTNYIQQVSKILRNKKVKFSTVIFPDYRVSLQTKFQDWARWACYNYVDIFTPLILTSDSNLAQDMLIEIKRKAGSNVKVYPGLFAGFIESDPEDLLKQIHIVRHLRMGGIILFDWAHLKPAYLEVLKTSAFKEQP